MGGIRLFLILVVGGIAASAVPRAWGDAPLRFSATGFSPAQENAVQEALFNTRQSIQACPLLNALFPWLQKTMLELVDSGDLKVHFASLNEQKRQDRRDECANSSPSYFVPTKKMVLQPQAFSGVCYGLDRVLFHELVHMSWTFSANPHFWGWGSEEVISSIEAECSANGAFENRKNQYR